MIGLTIDLLFSATAFFVLSLIFYKDQKDRENYFHGCMSGIIPFHLMIDLYSYGNMTISSYSLSLTISSIAVPALIAYVFYRKKDFKKKLMGYVLASIVFNYLASAMYFLFF